MKNNEKQVINKVDEGLPFDTGCEQIKSDTTLYGEKSCSKCDNEFADFMKHITPPFGIDFEENYCIWCTYLKESDIFSLFLESILGEDLSEKEILGRLLRVGREKAGLSLEALSQYCEVPFEYIQRLEEGKYISRCNIKKYNNFWLENASDSEIIERIQEHIVYKLSEIDEK